MASPTVDHTATANANSTGSISLSLAATSAGELVVIFVVNCTGTPQSAVSVSGGGLTFSRRSSFTSGVATLETWYARATASFGSTAFTISFAASFANAVAIGVTMAGVNATPWDGNASLPNVYANATPSGSTTPSWSGVSTTEADDYIFEAGGGCDTGFVQSVAGFTQLGQDSNYAGYYDCTFALYGRSVAAVQSNVSYVSQGTVSQYRSGGGTVGVIDALTADSPPSPGTAVPQNPVVNVVA